MDECLPQVYSRLSDIVSELQERRNNKELVQKVLEFFSSQPLLDIGEYPRAFISRSIATPNREMKYFLDLLEGTEFKPVVLEYNGKFVARNSEKYHLCKPHFCDIRKGTYATKRIVDFNTWEGKYMHTLQTIGGKSLFEVHRHMLKVSGVSEKIETLDITEWFNTVRSMDEKYYFHFLSLFVVHGALFENYLREDKQEHDFFMQKVWPSFLKVKEYFGVQPLIYPLLPTTHENRKEWLHYHKDLEKLL